MDVPKPENTEESESLPGSSRHSKSEKFTMPPVPEKPITVQELGNMYAEWRMANKFSPGTEEWMPNQTIMLIPAPKRRFNWKGCWSMLALFATVGVVAGGFAYYIDNYTSYKITSPRRGLQKLIPKYETTTEEIKFDPKLDEQMKETARMLKEIEEAQRSREKMMKEAQRIVEQYKTPDPYFRIVSEYEERHKKQTEEQKSPEKYQDSKDEVRELISHLSQKRPMTV